MIKNLVFVGGIHGVGKSTVCQNLSRLTNYTHHTASHLIKAKKPSTISVIDKGVKNIDDNQSVLIDAINDLNEKNILLDGHFSVLDQAGIPQAISHCVFTALHPILLLILHDNPDDIANRLKNRDGKEYSAKEIEAHQLVELDNAASISRKLGINLMRGLPNDSTLAAFTAVINKIGSSA